MDDIPGKWVEGSREGSTQQQETPSSPHTETDEVNFYRNNAERRTRQSPRPTRPAITDGSLEQAVLTSSGSTSHGGTVSCATSVIRDLRYRQMVIDLTILSSAALALPAAVQHGHSMAQHPAIAGVNGLVVAGWRALAKCDQQHPAVAGRERSTTVTPLGSDAAAVAGEAAKKRPRDASPGNHDVSTSDGSASSQSSVGSIDLRRGREDNNNSGSDRRSELLPYFGQRIAALRRAIALTIMHQHTPDADLSSIRVAWTDLLSHCWQLMDTDGNCSTAPGRSSDGVEPVADYSTAVVPRRGASSCFGGPQVSPPLGGYNTSAARIASSFQRLTAAAGSSSLADLMELSLHELDSYWCLRAVLGTTYLSLPSPIATAFFLGRRGSVGSVESYTSAAPSEMESAGDGRQWVQLVLGRGRGPRAYRVAVVPCRQSSEGRSATIGEHEWVTCWWSTRQEVRLERARRARQRVGVEEEDDLSGGGRGEDYFRTGRTECRDHLLGIDIASPALVAMVSPTASPAEGIPRRSPRLLLPPTSKEVPQRIPLPTPHPVQPTRTTACDAFAAELARRLHSLQAEQRISTHDPTTTTTSTAASVEASTALPINSLRMHRFHPLFPADIADPTVLAEYQTLQPDDSAHVWSPGGPLTQEFMLGFTILNLFRAGRCCVRCPVGEVYDVPSSHTTTGGVHLDAGPLNFTLSEGYWARRFGTNGLPSGNAALDLLWLIPRGLDGSDDHVEGHGNDGCRGDFNVSRRKQREGLVSSRIVVLVDELHGDVSGDQSNSNSALTKVLDSDAYVVAAVRCRGKGIRGYVVLMRQDIPTAATTSSSPQQGPSNDRTSGTMCFTGYFSYYLTELLSAISGTSSMWRRVVLNEGTQQAAMTDGSITGTTPGSSFLSTHLFGAATSSGRFNAGCVPYSRVVLDLDRTLVDLERHHATSAINTISMPAKEHQHDRSTEFSVEFVPLQTTPAQGSVIMKNTRRHIVFLRPHVRQFVEAIKYRLGVGGADVTIVTRSNFNRAMAIVTACFGGISSDGTDRQLVTHVVAVRSTGGARWGSPGSSQACGDSTQPQRQPHYYLQKSLDLVPNPMALDSVEGEFSPQRQQQQQELNGRIVPSIPTVILEDTPDDWIAGDRSSVVHICGTARESECRRRMSMKSCAGAQGEDVCDYTAPRMKSRAVGRGDRVGDFAVPVGIWDALSGLSSNDGGGDVPRQEDEGTVGDVAVAVAVKLLSKGFEIIDAALQSGRAVDEATKATQDTTSIFDQSFQAAAPIVEEADTTSASDGTSCCSDYEDAASWGGRWVTQGPSQFDDRTVGTVAVAETEQLPSRPWGSSDVLDVEVQYLEGAVEAVEMGPQGAAASNGDGKHAVDDVEDVVVRYLD